MGTRDLVTKTEPEMHSSVGGWGGGWEGDWEKSPLVENTDLGGVSMPGP